MLGNGWYLAFRCSLLGGDQFKPRHQQLMLVRFVPTIFSDATSIPKILWLRIHPKRGLTLWRRVNFLDFLSSPERVRPLFG